jgi:hypothetical protein
MNTGLIAFLLIVAFIAGLLFAFRRNAKQPLPKNLPPPLQDDDEDESNK